MTISHTFFAATLCVACVPELVDEDWLVDAPRVLAVQSEPAEARPGANVVFTALLAMPPALDASERPVWSFCSEPKPLTDNNAVAEACLGLDKLVRIGEGQNIETALPTDSCRVFGPDAPPGGFRPRDPDITGGYYQPVRVDLLGSALLFYQQRLSCGLANANSEVASAYARQYRTNLGPRIAGWTATSHGREVDLGEVPSGTQLSLKVWWDHDARETFVYVNPISQKLDQQLESLQVNWYTNAGTLEGPIVDVPEPAVQESSISWSAPTTASRTQIWVVLRDSRAGVDFMTLDVETVP